MMEALDRVYRVVPQKGCLFRLSKSIYKCVQQEGLILLCNVDYELESYDLSRTNNDLDGWHNRFACAFQQRHARSLKDFKTILR